MMFDWVLDIGIFNSKASNINAMEDAHLGNILPLSTHHIFMIEPRTFQDFPLLLKRCINVQD